MRGYCNGEAKTTGGGGRNRASCAMNVYPPFAYSSPRPPPPSPHHYPLSLRRHRSPSRRSRGHRGLGAGGAVGGQPVVRHGHWLPPDHGPSLCHPGHCGRTHCGGTRACALAKPNRWPGTEWRRSATGVSKYRPCPLPRTPSQHALHGGPEGYAACNCHRVDHHTGDARHNTVHEYSWWIHFGDKIAAARASISSRTPRPRPPCSSR